MANSTLPNIEPGSVVTLTSTGSGTWAQSTGQPVALAGAGNVRTFEAPKSLTGQTLTFTDGIDIVTVQVLGTTERFVAGGAEVPVILALGSGDFAGTPAVPTLTLTASPGDGVIDLGWVLSDGTADTYTVGRDGTDTTGYGAFSTTDPGSASSRRFDKLNNGFLYTLTVTAALSSGGSITQTITAVPNIVTLTPVLDVVAAPGDGFVDISWILTNATAVSFTDGRDGVDSTGYGAYSTTDPADAASRRFDKLINGTAYLFSVTATLDDGTTVTTQVTSTPTAAPVPVPVLTMATAPGNAYGDVTWSLANGTATGYSISRSGGSPVTLAGNATTYRFDTLTNGTTYTITLVATLAGGGALTQIRTVTPAAPVGPTLTLTATSGDSQVTIAWSLSGATANTYTDGRDGTDSTGYGPYSTTDPASTTSRVFDKLVNGTTYHFTVTANLADGSTITQTATATPSVVVVPTLTMGASPGSGYVDVTWTLANATATSFTVSRPSSSFTDAGSATSRRFSGLTNGTAYTFTVVANLVGGGTLTKTATATPTAVVTQPSGRRIPLAGKSGLAFNTINLSSNDVSGAINDGNARRREFDGMMWFLSRGSWGELNSGWGSDKASYVASGHIVISTMPHAPQNFGDSIVEVGASNGYATEQRGIGATIAAAGLNSPLHVIRIDWECNGDWYAWSAKNGRAALLKQAIINFVTNVRAGGATQVKFSLCFNKGPSQAGADFAINPGPAYIDVLTIDEYDWYDATFNDGTWNNEIHKLPALETVRAEAVRQGQMWGLEEGGNVHDGAGGGDNPFYWQKIWQFFNANASTCAYHVTYNNAGAPATLHHDWDSNPNSFNYYKTTFGGF